MRPLDYEHRFRRLRYSIPLLVEETNVKAVDFSLSKDVIRRRRIARTCACINAVAIEKSKKDCVRNWLLCWQKSTGKSRIIFCWGHVLAPSRLPQD